MVKVLPFLCILIISTNSLKAQDYPTPEFERTRKKSENFGFRNDLTFFNKVLQREYQVNSFRNLSEEVIEKEEHLIDSTITYQYNGLKDSIPIYRKVGAENVSYSFDLKNQEWVKKDSTVSYFSDNRINTGWETFKWNEEQQRWIESFKIQFDFDSEGRQILVANYQWDNKNGNWKGEGKRTNSFYHEGSLKDEIAYNWDDLNSNWIEYSKIEYSFDETLNFEIRQNFFYNISLKEWELSSVSRTEKFVEDEVEVRISYRANGDEWILSGKSEYVYDDYGNLLLENQYTYNLVTNSWDIYLRFEGEAIEKSRHTLQITSFANPETQVLEPSHKRVDEYDDQLRTVQSLHYSWDLGTQQWIGEVRWDYLYDINLNGKGLNIDKTYKWDNEASDWELEQKMFHYYQNSIISGIDDENFDLRLILYPNPVTTELSIKSTNQKIEELWVYSSSGSLIDVVSNINKEVFKLHFKYPEGYYFLRIRTNNSVDTYKIVK